MQTLLRVSSPPSKSRSPLQTTNNPAWPDIRHTNRSSLNTRTSNGTIPLLRRSADARVMALLQQLLGCSLSHSLALRVKTHASTAAQGLARSHYPGFKGFWAVVLLRASVSSK
jgi:hypothetical protein